MQIIIATVQGIILSKDGNLLSNTGLSEGCPKYLLKHIGFVNNRPLQAAGAVPPVRLVRFLPDHFY